jgi:endogenous inhibitor of DNA gyrase (YacG/DUF329 family)
VSERASDSARGKCPVCARPKVHEFRPFCSRRCADIDLSRWLRGSYAIPGEPDRTEPDMEAEAPRAADDPAEGR